MYPSPIEKLINSFLRFPTVGKRTATRFAFYLLNAPNQEIQAIIDNLRELKSSVTLCNLCFSSVLKNDDNLCKICKDKKRERETLCLIEKETDLLSIEKTNEYHGLYFILGGTVAPLKKQDFKNIRVDELKDRIINHKKYNLPKIKEVIIATNQNTEGQATAIYLERVLKELNIKCTRLGRGLSTGSELEYADEETISYALKGRN